ncbi:hypothetical protein OG612_45145 (plasmid) [Streptomyces sp. NBC_01527]|uniref:hypothetical protein n=1 Tax=Streptomyces sp. NBC_01527 TaxID=2903894 RepID=UPI002F90895B
MADDDRGADVFTLPTINLSPPGSTPDDDHVPTLPAPPSTAPPPDFTLPFHLPADEEDSSEHDPDNAAGEMVTQATNGTGTPTRATASMAMVTMAAIAVAALRGTWSAAAYMKSRREHHDAVADKAREAADKQKVANAAQAAKGRSQTGPEFGRGAAKGGGRGGSSGGASGGSGRGTFGQQKPSSKGSGRTPASSRSTGAGGRGAGPKGLKGPGSRNDSGGPGRKGGNGSGSTGSGSGKGSAASSPKKPGALGQMALARQKRKADEAKAQRQAAAGEQKADLADRASARRQAEKDADIRRKRKAEKWKAKLERAKASDGDTSSRGPKSPKGDKTGKGKDDAEKVDLKKKPKTGDGTKADPKDDKTGKGKDDAEKVDLKKKPKGSGTSSTSWWKRRSRRKKPGGGHSGPKAHRSRRTRGKRRSTDPGGMPGDDGEWLKPPPGWDVEYSVTIEREPTPHQSPPRQPRGAIGTGQKGLPAGKGGKVTPTRTEPKESPIVMGTAAAVGEVGDTQFVDADLTVYDLIDSDEDMGEQILLGVDHMRVVASKCEGLRTGLENLYAMCLQKKVPGVLVKWCIRLMERAGSVLDKAEALAASLPRASEAILAARDVAIEADKRRADAVKDEGHVAPAEREYHNRSGV